MTLTFWKFRNAVRFSYDRCFWKTFPFVLCTNGFTQVLLPRSQFAIDYLRFWELWHNRSMWNGFVFSGKSGISQGWKNGCYGSFICWIIEIWWMKRTCDYCNLLSHHYPSFVLAPWLHSLWMCYGLSGHNFQCLIVWYFISTLNTLFFMKINHICVHRKIFTYPSATRALVIICMCEQNITGSPLKSKVETNEWLYITGICI